MTLDDIGRGIRECTKCKEQLINIPQPGYFKGKVLFIFQNPAVPIVDKWQDTQLKDKNLSIEQINQIYLSTIQNSKLGKFIDLLDIAWNDISIANLVKCPTHNNQAPNDIIINNCITYILEQINLLQPKLIILNGVLPKKYLFKELIKKYNVLCFMHYAFLSRSGVLNEYKEKYKQDIKKYY